MRFLSIYKTVERNTPPSAEEMAAMGKLIEEGMKKGWLISTEGCLPDGVGRAGAAQQGRGDGHRWSFHRIKGGRGWIRHSECEFEAGGDRAD